MSVAKKKRYVLPDGRIVYCYVNPIFHGSDKSNIEKLIEYIILTNGDCIVRDKYNSRYRIELYFDGISVWISNYPYCYGHLNSIYTHDNPFVTEDDCGKDNSSPYNSYKLPSKSHRVRLNELLKVLKEMGELPGVSTYTKDN